MGHALGELGGAGAGVGAAQVHVPLLGGGQGGPAGGAGVRHDEDALGAVPDLQDGGHDLGDDVPGLAQDHQVPDAHPLAGHLGGVVQGGPRHRGPGHADRLHNAERGDPAGTAHLDVNVQQPGTDLLGRVLVGGGPARHPGGVPHTVLEGAGVHLEDNAVDLVEEVVAVVGVAGDKRLPLLAPPDEPVVGGGGQAPGRQELVPPVLLGR